MKKDSSTSKYVVDRVDEAVIFVNDSESARSRDIIANEARQRMYINIAFLLVSFGYMLPWTSLGSLISYYKFKYGASFYVKLHCAYTLPGLPVAWLQHKYDSYFDVKYGSNTTYLLRGVVSNVIVIVIIPSLIFVDQQIPLIALFLILGVCGWLSHGSATMLASMHSNAAIAYLQTGFRCPEIYALLAVAVFSLGRSPTDFHLKLFYMMTSMLVFTGLFSWIYIVGNPRSTQCFEAKDYDLHEYASKARDHMNESRPLIARSLDENITSNSYSNAVHHELVFWEIFPLCIACFLTVFSTSFLSSFLAYVESSSTRDIEEILYFVRLFSDFIGRPLTRFSRPFFLRVIFFCSLGLHVVRLLICLCSTDQASTSHWFNSSFAADGCIFHLHLCPYLSKE